MWDGQVHAGNEEMDDVGVVEEDLDERGKRD